MWRLAYIHLIEIQLHDKQGGMEKIQDEKYASK